MSRFGSRLEVEENGYQSGDILSGGEESDYSEPEEQFHQPYRSTSEETDNTQSQVLLHQSSSTQSRSKHLPISRSDRRWPTPNRPRSRTREERFSGLFGSGSMQLPFSSNQPESSPDVHVEILQNLTNSIDRLVDRLDRQESRLSKIEDKLSTSSSSSSSPDIPKKSKVPLPIRSEVRRMYKALLEDKENFSGFDTSKGVTFNDSSNTDTLKILLREVSSANPSFQASHIKAAAYTYYKTLCAEDSLRRRGMLEGRNQCRRRRERGIRKLQSRTTALAKTSMPEKEKRKWEAILTADFMSSEESNSDSENSVIVKKTLPWRSDRVTVMFTKLDSVVDEGKSKFAKKQTHQRVISGEISTRGPPTGKYPSWGFSQ